ncbi:MAG TPA: 4-(cytidine 5'-diphospho)-2-C-methyl-D-erythritol kinase [Aliiroseovarius sp.]|nr:4-(cytidine 5'-diphospho)-2-C-methyl-D-erythritol kinase [Aliiroseovarius sp.]
MRAVKVFAPAKVNLTLHVTGQRADGYHLLDSLVAFADVGDRLTLRAAARTTLALTGPMAAGVPTGADNLVLRAASLFEQAAEITLSKHLPMQAGLGGGSSDAAATALGLADLTGACDLPPGLTALGADIRVCLMRRAARMRGIGEQVTPVAGLPPLPAVLVNPGVAVPTPDVFAALAGKTNAPMPRRLPRWRSAEALIAWLTTQRNDLEAPARAIAPEITETLQVLGAQPGCGLARMSGSGATCFGLFSTPDGAEAAACALAMQHPGWWVRAVTLA